LKKTNAVLSFRQACKFSEQSNGYYFYLATFIKKLIEANSKIYLKVKVKSELNTKKAYNSLKRKLDISEVQNAECSLVTMTELDENEVGAAGWNCYTGQSSIKNATGLDIIGSDDISGIPDNPELIDPAKTDNLIQNGDIKDYSLEENLDELLPIFNILATNFSLCKQNGSFSFIGNMSSSINKDILFNISLSYPSSSIACRLPRTLKGKIVQIECFNRDDFQNSTVIVEETVIRDGFNEYFILRNISSGDMLVTCSSSGKDVNEMKYSDDFRVISRTIKDESSGGIGTAGIIVLISVSVVVFAAIVILIVFLMRKNKKKIKNDNDKKTISSTTSSFGNSSSSYY
jgi:flagellar basal body-associated protein FliL